MARQNRDGAPDSASDIDGGPDTDARPRPVRDEGYRATGRLGEAQQGTTRFVGVALIALIAIGVVLGALGNDDRSLGPLLGDLHPTRTIDADATPYVPPPTDLPRVGILGFPLPERPFPMNAGWLRWLDPRTGTFQGDAEPTDRADPTLTFADAEGRVVQVCTARGSRADALIVSVDVCMFDQDGSLRTRFPVAMLRPERQALTRGGLVVEGAYALDAAVSRDGAWLWIAASVHMDNAWAVTIDRVDLAAARPAGSRRIRVIPEGAAPSEPASAEGWLVPPDGQVWPVVRASPGGSRLSLTMTEASIGQASSARLLNQERVELDSTLDPDTAIDVRFPARGAGDLACDARRAAWATDRHYLTICVHAESGGALQPFVRIENPADMTRDVAIGPAIAAADLTTDDSSWLLDARIGVLYRWSYVHRSFARFDVASRAGTTITFDPYGPPSSGDPWPARAAPPGQLVWTSLAGGTSPGTDILALAGSSDGSVLYALGQVPVRQAGTERLQATVWAIDSLTGHALDRWTAPGPIDQVAFTPGAGHLAGLVSPAGQFGPGPAIDWRTQMWFLDPRTGVPSEVLGDVRGPGFASPTLLPPSVAAFAGF